MFEFCITSITGWVGSRKTTNLALRNFEIFPFSKSKLALVEKNLHDVFSKISKIIISNFAVRFYPF
jgi:hypothetical protein